MSGAHHSHIYRVEDDALIPRVPGINSFQYLQAAVNSRHCLAIFMQIRGVGRGRAVPALQGLGSGDWSWDLREQTH